MIRASPHKRILMAGVTIALFLSVAALTAAHDAPKIAVTLYGESHCPDVQEFIRSQLVPVHDDLKHHIDVELVMFGFAVEKYTKHLEDGGLERVYDCQHGALECAGNEIMLCAANTTSYDMSAVLRFVECMQMQHPSATGRCAQEAGVSSHRIKRCYRKHGHRLHYEAAQKTGQLFPALDWTPTVVINGRQNRAAIQNLRVEICRELGPGAHACL